MHVRVLYFASLRDAAGCASETLDVDSPLLSELYDRQRRAHGFGLPKEKLRVAVNGAFVRWDDCAADGDDVAFIPPVSGG